MPQSDTRGRILDAATDLFLRQGYSNTSLDQVAQTAGVTKPTVYSHFGSKQGVLQAMTERHATRRVIEFQSELQHGGDPESELNRFAEAFLSRVISEEARAWHRLATAEAQHYPEVGEAFFEAGPQQVFDCLSDYLASEKRAGRLRIAHPRRAAERFLGMLLGLDLLRSLIGKPLPSRSSLRRRCRESVSQFLDAHRVEAGCAGEGGS